MIVDLNHNSGFQYVPDWSPPALPAVPPALRFTEADAHQAHDSWGANCGPGAIAAIMGMTLDEVRVHMGDFEGKCYTNPTLMGQALRSIRRPWKLVTRRPFTWPKHGLARVQWEGPWTAPAVPVRVRYRHTHWVASCWLADASPAIFDINCMPQGWVASPVWERIVVPWLLRQCEPQADGKWHLTHVIEVAPHG